MELQIVYEGSSRILTVDAPGDIRLYDDLSAITGCVFEHSGSKQILSSGIGERPGAVVIFSRGGSARKQSLHNTFSVIQYLRERFGNIKIAVLFLGREFEPVIKNVKRLGCDVAIGPEQSEAILFHIMDLCAMPEIRPVAVIVRKNRGPLLKLFGIEREAKHLKGKLLELLIYLAAQSTVARSRAEIAARLSCPEDHVKVTIWRLNQLLARMCAQTEADIRVRRIGKNKGFVLEIKKPPGKVVI